MLILQISLPPSTDPEISTHNSTPVQVTAEYETLYHCDLSDTHFRMTSRFSVSLFKSNQQATQHNLIQPHTCLQNMQLNGQFALTSDLYFCVLSSWSVLGPVVVKAYSLTVLEPNVIFLTLVPQETGQQLPLKQSIMHITIDNQSKFKLRLLFLFVHPGEKNNDFALQ